MRTRHSRIALMFTGGSVAFVAAISTTLAAQQSSVQTASPRATATAAAQTPARELVTTYCVSCHNPRVNAGSLALDSVDALQLVVALEKRFGLKLGDAAAAREVLQSVDSIANNLVAKGLA